MNAALGTEATKLTRSLVGVISTAAIIGGILALIGGITAAVAAGNPELTAKLGRSATLDWAGLLASSAQITAAGAFGGFGIVLAWMFAREFTDGTITGLFALPVGRGTIASAKIMIYLGWAVLVNLLTVTGLIMIGLLLGYGAPTEADWQGLGRQLVLGTLTATLALPVAWIATEARSLLAGVAVTVGLVVVGQVGVLAGAGGWLPIAAPALWALGRGTGVSAAQFGVVALFVIVFAVLTVRSWVRLQLDR
ncbi:ABC transporter permease [Microlunatus parietis]|uniref:ABC-2 type transport system permease protein n=1 Tax=Microlunatus parietis TaxID=682979 RepID=A0A7Y9I4K9_9ACTN|nr:ABC transporter permease [Microlunatus parietis]NYE69895.1 ABC-2 type transport system permease protein [Microlunatus parietis]